jgi:carboxymethylenebutenolidase
MNEQRNHQVKFTAGSTEAQGYLVLPAGEGPWPGVIVLQEWWGLDDHIKSVADRFAEAGFVALAPDLYNGQVATEPDEARKLAMSLRQSWEKTLAVIQAAVDLLVAHDQVAPKKIGITGFCMGGGLAWHGAAKLTNLGAAVPFYGGGPEMTLAEAKQIEVPVLAIYGELDQGVSPAVAQQRDQLLTEAGVPHETVIYPNAHHAFFNDTRPVYNAEAAEDAWQRMLTLFGKTLR